MLIRKIENINFNGKFTDKSAENKGNWRMEYRPYSWEITLAKGNWERSAYPPEVWAKHGMAPQEDLNILSDTLPDNEKIYVNNTSYDNNCSRIGKESSKDILGTTFYYCDYSKNKMRKTITVMPSMNLEESLTVKNDKLKKFLELKEKHKKEIEKNIDDLFASISSDHSRYESASYDYSLSFFECRDTRSTNKEIMDSSHYDIMGKISTISAKTKELRELSESMDKVRQQILENDKVIEVLKKSQEEGKLIDISQRDIYDPNKKLWDALQNFDTIKEKIIALPHKIISVKKLLEMIGNVAKTKEISQECIKMVDKLVKSCY